jgi:hypothetical protein
MPPTDRVLQPRKENLGHDFRSMTLHLGDRNNVPSHQCSIRDAVNLRRLPAIRLVASAEAQLQVIVGEGFGELAVGVVACDIQGDRVD